MRRWNKTLVLSVVATALLALPAMAPARLPVEPAGDYQKTCRKCRGDMKTSVLTCQCRRRDGRWVEARLNYRLCCRGVENRNGRLRCVNPVVGNFTRYCRNCTTRGYTLLCTCPRKDRGWYRATLFCKHCCGTVSFKNGRLLCDRKCPPSPAR